MQIVDTHVHSTYSADGSSRLGEYAAAIESGLADGIGFAEHIDFMPECGSYQYMDPRQYLNEVSEYRKRGFEFHAGGEIDYARIVEEDIIEHMKEFPYAYTICSVHMVDGRAVSNRTDLPAIRDRQLRREIIFKYYEELVWGIKAPVFDVMGHIGVYKRYLGKDFFEDAALRKEIEAAEDEVALLCARSDKAVEVNTSGLFSPLSALVPDEKFLRAYYQYGGRCVTVGSDAHCAAHLGRGLEVAYRLLRNIGFQRIVLPWDREKGISL